MAGLFLMLAALVCGFLAFIFGMCAEERGVGGYFAAGMVCVVLTIATSFWAGTLPS